MSREDLEYYVRRAREEAAAAAAAHSVEAASAHRLLAIEYEGQAQELRARLEGAARDNDGWPLDGPVRRRRPKLSIRTVREFAD